jgi:hypothetical protein
MLNTLTTPHQYPGRLFVVEGIDGSGKTTLVGGEASMALLGLYALACGAGIAATLLLKKEANILEAFGKSLGIGKEADVYDALTPRNERVAVKFHRLGRISFVRRKEREDM